LEDYDKSKEGEGKNSGFNYSLRILFYNVRWVSFLTLWWDLMIYKRNKKEEKLDLNLNFFRSEAQKKRDIFRKRVSILFCKK